MNRKVIIAIILALVWAILLVDRVFFSKGNVMPNYVATKPMVQRREKEEKNKEVTYPELKLTITNKALFQSPLQSLEERKVEKSEKKVITLPAPPMPILPEPKEVQREEPKVIPDPLADISLIGVLDKKSKKVAFIRKKKEIRPFYEGEPLYDTNFFVDKIGINVVILKSASMEERKLEIEKEAKDEKKQNK